MAASAASRRYARALFGIARDEGTIEATREELDRLAALVNESAELSQALLRPMFPAAERREVLRALCERLGSSDTLRSFYSLLIDQRRLVDLPRILEEFHRLADDAAGKTHGEVTSATELSAEQTGRLRAALSRRIGCEVEISVRVEPELLGGVVAKVGDLVFDGSLRTQLAQLRTTLTKGH